jgi:hypothetical protein
MNTNITSADSNRRDFIKQSAAGALAGSLAFPSILSAAPNTQTLRIGLIGCGGITQHHLKAYRDAGWDAECAHGVAQRHR